MGQEGCESIYQTIFRAKLGPSTIKFVYAKFHNQGLGTKEQGTLNNNNLFSVYHFTHVNFQCVP